MENFAVIKKLAAENYLAGIKAGIRYLHVFNIVYNNLNPINIAITENNIPVNIDFNNFSAPGAALNGIKRICG